MSKPNLDKMIQQKAELDARIQQARNHEAAEERKRDTRRKILAGAYVMKMAENDLQKLGKELMAAGMLAPRDHALFGVTADVNNDNNSSVDIV